MKSIAMFKISICFKILIIIIISALCLSLLSGCTPRQNINDLAYVIAIGLDVGETNELKLSLQISKTNNSSGKSDSASGSSQSSDSIINSVECSSIISGISMFNSFLGKEVNLSHCKVVVISEELASKGISEHLYTLKNNIQIHAEANMIVCRCTAEDFLNNSTPILETLSAKYYEIAPSSSEYTGYTDSVTFGEFFSYYTDTFQEAYAILGGLNKGNNNNSSTNNSNTNMTEYTDISSSDTSYIAGELPASTDVSIDTLGLAVFDSDKLVGELNGIETISHMIITNKLNRCTIRIPSPINIDNYLDLSVKLVSKPKIKVDLINNTPFIQVDVKVNLRLLSVTEDLNNLSGKNKNEIENYVNKYLEEIIINYLYKTSKILHSDIAGFGRYIVSDFLTWDDWISYNWNHEYSNSFFSVNIESYLKSGYLLLDV